MSEVNPPLFLTVNSSYGGDELGLWYRDLISEGVIGVDDLKVTTASDGLKINIAAGACAVRGDTNTDSQPTYRCRNDDTVQLTHTTADGSNPRIDRVVARVKDSTFSGSDDEWELAIIAGTPAANPDPPDEPDTALTLALVQIDAGATIINSGDITDSRARARVGGGEAQGDVYIGKMEPYLGAITGTGLVEVTARGDGWYWCNGAEFSTTTFAALDTFLGGAYEAGDESAGNSRLPDFTNGRSPVGAGGSFDRGEKGGSTDVTLTEAQLPAHDHTIQNSGNHTHATTQDSTFSGRNANSFTVSPDSNFGFINLDNLQNETTGAGGNHNHGGATGNAGSGSSHENMPPWQAIGGWIIYAGV